MERHGFIHDMLDVKILILFILNRVLYPVNGQQIYELCFQDDCLSYFDVQIAIPQLVQTGHIEEIEGDKYRITQKGKEQGSVTEDTIAFTVRQQAERAVYKFNREVQRKNYVKTEISQRPDSDYSVVMSLDDDTGNLMKLELLAPNQRQAILLSRAFEKTAETLYQMIMSDLLEEIEG